ncbi:YtxH domain-containing protein [Candidatus Peregrinibacteria bacterium]|nr:YtxH domain-containing protein [Candidatus Peregrinibacteria bacterium]
MARGGKFGWFLGLIFGTLFGVLFAPRKGKELRAKIKDDRKKGRLGIAPLQDDLKHLGQQLASLARQFYESDTVQDIVVAGRKKVKSLSKDFVGEVHDFHYNRIHPLQDEVKAKVHFIKGKMEGGKRAINKAHRKLNEFAKKAKTSARIGKRAAKEIKHVMKKKHAS